ncbi:hypothetical protein MXB_5208 [Myxobolus squamalis]|nr:hypothetical protein MXB_5208 [Myxobolus squamalis]
MLLLFFETKIQILFNVTRNVRKLRQINYDKDFEKTYRFEKDNLILAESNSRDLKNVNRLIITERILMIICNGNQSPIRYKEEIDEIPDYNLRYDRFKDKNSQFNAKIYEYFVNDNKKNNGFSRSNNQEEKTWKNIKPHDGGFNNDRNNKNNDYKNTYTPFSFLTKKYIFQMKKKVFKIVIQGTITTTQRNGRAKNLILTPAHTIIETTNMMTIKKRMPPSVLKEEKFKIIIQKINNEKMTGENIISITKTPDWDIIKIQILKQLLNRKTKKQAFLVVDHSMETPKTNHTTNFDNLLTITRSKLNTIN